MATPHRLPNHLNKHMHALRHNLINNAARTISSSSARASTHYFNHHPGSNVSGKNAKGGSMGSVTTTTTTTTVTGATTGSVGISTSAPAQASVGSVSATTHVQTSPSMSKTSTIGSLKQSAMSIPHPRPVPSTSTTTSQASPSSPTASASASHLASLPYPLPLPPSIPKPRPLPNSYWATPHLLACEYPYAPLALTPLPKLDALLRAGVRVLIDLTEPGELAVPYNLGTIRARARAVGLGGGEVERVAYYRFPIPDRQVPTEPRTLERINALLRYYESRETIAAVHCRGGIGRTGTVVGCWLVESGRARDGEEALGIIGREWCTVEKRGRFPCSPETGVQWEYVRGWRRGVGEVVLEMERGMDMESGRVVEAEMGVLVTTTGAATGVNVTMESKW